MDHSSNENNVSKGKNSSRFFEDFHIRIARFFVYLNHDKIKSNQTLPYQQQIHVYLYS